MPPIPIYANSPINAAKADGVTPQTAANGHGQPTNNSNPPPTTTQQANAYPPAQPGASPAVPAPTGTASISQLHQPVQPTPTLPLAESPGPPPPQPGAVPLPPFSTSVNHGGAVIPPPPKATGTATTASTTTAPPPYPAQMNIPPPTGTSTGALPQSVQRGTATTTTFSGLSTGAGGFVPGPSPLEHPPGYQQDVNADALNRYQRAAQDALEDEERRTRRTSSAAAAGLGGLAGDEDGVWSGAKKMMAAAGEKLAAAEGEVWKRINKD